MEQLDLVYNTFINLEKNYARSKKSRKDYLLEKFGGDIAVGSMIILDALSRLELTKTEDIEKLSAIRDMFASIAEYQDKLDSITDFNFSETAGSKLYKVLDAALEAGAQLTLCTTEEVEGQGFLHFKATPKGTQLVPIGSAKLLCVYNEPMAAYATSVSGETAMIGDLYEKRIGNRYVKVPYGAV